MVDRARELASATLANLDWIDAVAQGFRNQPKKFWDGPVVVEMPEPMAN